MGLQKVECVRKTTLGREEGGEEQNKNFTRLGHLFVLNNHRYMHSLQNENIITSGQLFYQLILYTCS